MILPGIPFPLCSLQGGFKGASWSNHQTVPSSLFLRSAHKPFPFLLDLEKSQDYSRPLILHRVTIISLLKQQPAVIAKIICFLVLNPTQGGQKQKTQQREGCFFLETWMTRSHRPKAASYCCLSREDDSISAQSPPHLTLFSQASTEEGRWMPGASQLLPGQTATGTQSLSSLAEERSQEAISQRRPSVRRLLPGPPLH